MRTSLCIAPAPCAAGFASAAAAQVWPAEPIHWIVPFPAGSGTDVMTRAIAQPLAASVGKPVLVENRAGAHTLIGLGAAHQVAGNTRGLRVVA